MSRLFDKGVDGCFFLRKTIIGCGENIVNPQLPTFVEDLRLGLQSRVERFSDAVLARFIWSLFLEGNPVTKWLSEVQRNLRKRFQHASTEEDLEGTFLLLWNIFQLDEKLGRNLADTARRNIEHHFNNIQSLGASELAIAGLFAHLQVAMTIQKPKLAVKAAADLANKNSASLSLFSLFGASTLSNEMFDTLEKQLRDRAPDVHVLISTRISENPLATSRERLMRIAAQLSLS